MVGLDYFRFLFSSKDAFIITEIPVLYNLGFIFYRFTVSVGLPYYPSASPALRELSQDLKAMLFLYFLSWVIIKLIQMPS